MFDYQNTKYEEAEIVIKDLSSAQNAIELLEKREETAENCCYLSKAYLYVNNYKKSLKYAKKAKKLNSDYKYADARIIFAYSKLKERNKALTLLDKLYECETDFITDCICFVTLANIDRGNLHFKKLCNKFANKNFVPNNAYEYEFKIISSLFSKKYKNADKYIKRAEELNYTNSSLFQFISFVYYQFEKYKESLNYAEKAILLNCKDSYNYYRKGWAEYRLKQQENSLESFLVAESLGCKYIDMYNYIADLYYMKGDYKKALIYTNKAIILDRKNIDAHYAKGFILYEISEFDKALQSFLKAEELGCTYGGIHSKISFIYSFKNEYTKALEYANKALMLNRDAWYEHYQKGWVLCALGEEKKAKESLLKAEELGCTYNDMYASLAYLYYTSEENQKALSYVNKALLTNKEDACAYSLKAEILLRLGKEKEANKCYQKAEELSY